MEVLRRCPLATAQRLVHRAIAVSTAVLGRVTRTMSVAMLLRNNSKRKKSNFRSPAPPPYSWSLDHFDLTWNLRVGTSPIAAHSWRYKTHAYTDLYLINFTASHVHLDLFCYYQLKTRSLSRTLPYSCT